MIGATVAKELERARLTESTSAVAGLTNATSVAATTLAAVSAPTGLAGFSVLVGLSAPPLIVVLAPYAVGLAVATSAVAGGVRFYNWYRQRCEERDDGYPPVEN